LGFSFEKNKSLYRHRTHLKWYKNLMGLKIIWSSRIFKDSKNQILNNCIIKENIRGWSIMLGESLCISENRNRNVVVRDIPFTSPRNSDGFYCSEFLGIENYCKRTSRPLLLYLYSTAPVCPINTLTYIYKRELETFRTHKGHTLNRAAKKNIIKHVIVCIDPRCSAAATAPHTVPNLIIFSAPHL